MMGLQEASLPQAGRLPCPTSHAPLLLRGAPVFPVTRPALHIALINNASDVAFDGVTRQFRDLLCRAARGRAVRLHVATSAAIMRQRRHLESIDQLMCRQQLDAAIMTGAEPARDRLEDEPFWAELTGFYDWAEAQELPLVLSCLAAHAVVQHVCKLRRVRLREKCFGVFETGVAADHPVLRGMPEQFVVPHSRWNTLPVHELAAAGFRVLTYAPGVGVDSFTGPHRAQQIFLQGHPEYGAGSLMAEYQRDVRRYLRALRSSYPELPLNCLQPAQAVALRQFRSQAMAQPCEAAMQALPNLPRPATGQAAWWHAAEILFANWLDHVAEMRGSAAPVAGMAGCPSMAAFGPTA
jgi:homoserine O-succinyltransferase